MKSKNRIIVSLCSIIGVLVIALVAVVVVFASANASVTSNIYVSYTAENVSAVITATYQLEGDASATSMTTSSGATSITFTPTSSTSSGSLSPANTLGFKNSVTYVVFAFTFQNGSSTNTISLSGTATLSGDTDKYDTSYGTTSACNLSYSSGSEMSDTIPTTSTNSGKFTMYFKVEITNLSDSSTISVAFSWTLTQVTS